MTVMSHQVEMLDDLLMEREATADGSPKRRQILDAAERLFLGQGYGAVSMDAVARAAAVSKATLYAYFASKDQLFATIVGERGLAHMLEDLGTPPDGGDLRAALLAVGDRILRFMLDERTLRIYRIAVAESGRFPELGRAFHENGPQRSCARFQAWLADQLAAGQLDVPRPEVAAGHFIVMLRGGVFLRATLSAPPPPTEAEIVQTVTDAVDAWLRAYGRPREPRPA
jgi:TetR/AcrR family transcriptional repressor of mexJK operon